LSKITFKAWVILPNNLENSEKSCVKSQKKSVIEILITKTTAKSPTLIHPSSLPLSKK